MENAFPLKAQAKEIYGAANLLLSPNEIHKDGSWIVKDKDSFLTGVFMSKADIDAEAGKLEEMQNFCDRNRIGFLYVSYPTKSDYDIDSKTYGIDTNSEEKRKALLSELKGREIKTLDISGRMKESGYTSEDIFYKTDHHWKTPYALFATDCIAEYLQENMGAKIQTGLLSPENFAFTEHRQIWLGETGRAVSKTWTGTLDDYTEIEPDFPTSFEIGIADSDEKKTGDFSIMMDKSGYYGGNDLYQYSAHYSYKVDASKMHVKNLQAKDECSIFLIKDSFSVPVISFLSCAASDVYVWDMRDDNKENVYDFIKKNSIDYVIVAYSGTWMEYMFDFDSSNATQK
ncbi:MAG: DHHW family protein [Lachnospiraceae bacterium]|nr:DHHW family protein [Lachnospiraceae bacterium]